MRGLRRLNILPLKLGGRFSIRFYSAELCDDHSIEGMSIRVASLMGGLHFLICIGPVYHSN